MFVKVTNDCLVYNRLKELAHDTEETDWTVLRGRTSITSILKNRTDRTFSRNLENSFLLAAIE